MRNDRAGLLAMVLAVAIGASARAQEGLRGPGPAIGGFHLIAMPQVQQELGLDESQVASAREVAGRMNARFGQDISKMKGLNAAEKTKRSMTLAGPHYDEGMRELRSFLKPAQIERFDQILFQQRGPMAMLEPKIAPMLQLQNEQARKVAELVARAENEQRSAVQAAGNDRQAVGIKLEAIAARANEEAVGLLSPEQKRTWSRLTGVPFRPDLGGDQPGGATPKAR